MNDQSDQTTNDSSVDPDKLKIFSNFQFQLSAKFFSFPISNGCTDQFAETFGVFQNIFVSGQSHPAVNSILELLIALKIEDKFVQIFFYVRFEFGILIRQFCY